MGTSKGKGKYLKPEDIEKYCKEYVNDCVNNPILVHDYTKSNGKKVYKEVHHTPSWIGFEGYLAELGIIQDLSSYEQDRDGRYTEYIPIITWAKKFIKARMIKNGLAGVANPNLTARLGGIADNQNNNNKHIEQPLFGKNDNE